MLIVDDNEPLKLMACLLNWIIMGIKKGFLCLSLEADFYKIMPINTFDYY